MPDVGSVKYKVELDNKGIDQEINTTESKISTKLGSAFGKTAGAIGAAAATAVAAGAAAVTNLVKKSVEAYGEYEQLAGGIETLYKGSADKMMAYADEAWKTAGLSVNDYMNTAIESSAAMINALGGDVDAAADKTNQAIIDMADNVNKMGTDMEAVQNAYRGFSRGNFTMLDNLALGFAGTKEGMQELLDAAQQISGVEYDISSYADIVDAIHVVQTEMGITGTTAQEAATTLQGSLESMKSAWNNLLTGMADPNADIGKLIGNMVDSAKTFIGNLVPIIKQSLTGITGAIKELAPVIAKELPGMIRDTLPDLLEAGASVVETLLRGIMDALPDMLPVIIDFVVTFVKMLLDMAPELVQTGVTLIGELIKGIAQAIPEILPAIVDAILAIVEVLVDPDNVSLIIDAVIQLVMAIVKALPQIIMSLLDALPTIIKSIIQGLMQAIPQLISGLIQIVIELVKHLPEIIAAFIKAIPEIIMAILEAFGPIGEGLANLFSGAWEGIKNIFSSVGSWFGEKFTQAKENAATAWSNFKDIMGNVWDKTKDVFSSVGSWFGDKFKQAKENSANAWANFKDGMSTVWEKTKGVFSSVGSWFGDKFKQAKENSTNAWNNIKEKFSGIWDKIKSGFRFGDALQWGKDMIQNFIDGIKAMIGRVKDAVCNIADTVKSFLGFSEPDEGPLSNFHTFAPDMIDLYTKGIDDNIGEVEDSVENVSKIIAGSFNADVGYNLPDISGYAADLSAALTAQTSTEIVVPISIDGREVARATAWYTNEQLAWEAR